MARLIAIQNEWSKQGKILALYFAGAPTADEVAREWAGLGGAGGPQWEHEQTPLADYAGLTRVAIRSPE